MESHFRNISRVRLLLRCSSSPCEDPSLALRRVGCHMLTLVLARCSPSTRPRCRRKFPLSKLQVVSFSHVQNPTITNPMED